MRSNHFLILVLLFSSFSLFVLKVHGDSPHILLIVLDDLGWSDVGFHGSTINTPNMDKLASEGVILDNYYVQPICSPTRGALLSGMYPIHTGLQSGIIRSTEPYGLPLNITILPQKLKEAGYSTHMIGKWHLGFCSWSYTPLNRGFDSFYGIYLGAGNHYTHETAGILDLHDNETPVENKDGVYSTYLYAEQAQKVIESHNASTPLFLYLPFQSVHSPLQVPTEYTEKYENITDDDRKIYAGMVENVDEAIGNITEAMKTAGLWDNTLLIVTTDNGGAPDDGGYNWPLRGEKGSLWEGGVRGVAFVHGNMLQRTGVTCNELFHVTDWYPTLLYLAGIEKDSDSSALDGYNIWSAISEGAASERTEILHYIDGDTAAIRVGDMKLLLNVTNKDWYKPPELSSEARKTKKRSGGTIRVALYNITADPYESQDLKSTYPALVRTLRRRVTYYKTGEVPSGKVDADPKAKTLARKNGYWGPWID
ncbi:unnamed protein product [Porites lobata]|uniref:Sulfatase N-terminal domain-containing protein n=1 Tax=Porites lobata TaxID=104759 RepID=A0ABN8RUX0_9CNID|nr:unnamed protein product [Porites lobata]